MSSCQRAWILRSESRLGWELGVFEFRHVLMHCCSLCRRGRRTESRGLGRLEVGREPGNVHIHTREGCHVLGCLWGPLPASPRVVLPWKCRWEADTQAPGRRAALLMGSPSQGCAGRMLCLCGLSKWVSWAVTFLGHLLAQCCHIYSFPLRSEVKHPGGNASPPTAWDWEELADSDALSRLSGRKKCPAESRWGRVRVGVWGRERGRETGTLLIILKFCQN